MGIVPNFGSDKLPVVSFSNLFVCTLPVACGLFMEVYSGMLAVKPTQI